MLYHNVGVCGAKCWAGLTRDPPLGLKPLGRDDSEIREQEFMAKRTIVTMPGDGIGNQVLPEAIRVLDAVGFEAEYIHADIGWECWKKEANALPERTIELLSRHKLALFGAITSKPKKEAEAELSPTLKGKGCQYFSPIVSMRQRFGLDLSLRPCLSFPGNPLNFIRKKPGGRIRRAQG